jgi:hypothetical protein
MLRRFFAGGLLLALLLTLSGMSHGGDKAVPKLPLPTKFGRPGKNRTYRFGLFRIGK